jgi:hypothetical protein
MIKQKVIKDNKLSKLINQWKNDRNWEFIDPNDIDDLPDKKYYTSFKVDGEASALLYQDNKCIISSRHGKVRYNLPFADEINFALSKYKKAVLFGELYAVDKDNETILPYPKTMSIIRKPDENTIKQIRFMIYDIYSLNDNIIYDGKNETYPKRYNIIDRLFKNLHNVNPCKLFYIGKEEIKHLYETNVLTNKYEGLVIYDDNKTYKLKKSLNIDAAVIFIEASDKHPDMAGSVGLALKEGNKFYFIGKVGTGFSTDFRKKLLKYAKKNYIKKEDNIYFIEPKIVFEVNAKSFNEGKNVIYDTKYNIIGHYDIGSLREPKFIRIRDDKKVDDKDVGISQIPQKYKVILKKASLYEPLKESLDYGIPQDSKSLNNKESYKIYIDIDGVLADFVTALHNRLNIPFDYVNYPYKHGEYDIFKLIEDKYGIKYEDIIKLIKDKNFWANIPPYSNARKIVNDAINAVGLENVYILTRPMEELDGEDIVGKKEFIEKNFPELKDKIIFSKNKELFANKNSILIDDWDKNINSFIENGGQGNLVARPWNSGYKSIKTFILNQWFIVNSYFPSHPNNKIDGLTEKDVWEYYEKNKDKIFPYIKNRTVLFRLKTDNGFIILRKDPKTKEDIKIRTIEDYDKYNNGRNVEWHIVIPSKRSDILYIDLDPKEKFDKSKINDIIRDIVNNINDYIKNIKNIEIFKSGGRGYHIFIFLNKPMDVDKARKLLKRLAKDIILPRYEKVTLSIPKKDEMRFDVTTLHYKGSLSVPYSLNAKTLKPGEKIDFKKI